MNNVEQDIRNLPDVEDGGWEFVTIGNEARSGESILIHMPNGKWMIVDSCTTNLYKQKNSALLKRQNLPLLYLDWRKQNAKDVELIVCTHWHKDHCDGISHLLTQCENATLILAKHSVDFINLYYDYVIKNQRRGIIDENDEFRQCMNLLSSDESPRKYTYATMDKLICSNYDIATLSPTDKNNDDYDQSLLKKYGLQTYNCLKDPNSTSVAISIRHEKLAALLGADLSVQKCATEVNFEDNTDFNEHEKINLENILKMCQDCEQNNEGWCYVCHRSNYLKRTPKYEFVKIPHHSSSNGYCRKLYKDFVSPTAIGVSTTFASSSLPSQTMLDKLKEHLGELYVTDKSNSTLRDEDLEPIIREYLDSLKGVKFLERRKEIGVVVSFFKDGIWETKRFGNAYQEKKDATNTTV